MRITEELRYLVLAAQREGNRLLAQELRPLGLTPSQAEVIRVLNEQGGLTLNGLGELLVCESGTNPSRLVDRIVNAGLAERRPSTTDRRTVTVALTPAGVEIASQIGRIEDHIYSLINTALDDKQQQRTVDALRCLVAGTPAGEALTKRVGSRPNEA
jgi:MarR family transcriptional regulator, organic hydroperoxide resistance regulator